MVGQAGRPTEYRLYAVYTQIDPNSPPVFRESANVLTVALESLRAARQQAPDQGSFIVPANAAERDEFPYRNRIGPVPDKDSKHWGYRYRVPGTSDVLIMYVEKRQLAQGGKPPKPSLKEELEAEGMVEEVRKLEVDYVVYNHAQIAADRAVGRRYDEDTRDFVFDGE